MEEQVYSGSALWFLADLIRKVGFVTFPLMFLLISSLCIKIQRDLWAYISLVGACLVFGANLVHRYSGEIRSVWLSYPIPEVNENVLVWYIAIHGLNTGLLIFGIGTAGVINNRRST
ncbi:hypothetical protein HBA55_17875 [Pseudomaricurvus alkylphenolicus]|uniref:hypothetical protein n=1 Tax=Pseudomaricurvus alkylphenolicus TaxID=1306991 RepID=UPI00141EB4B2|nr:hypothetical protein [Pseudomaricurvus alkylphenolicus]NIB41476.1 hypothetical protein [Pseudomaricurvus alkylphenolicus]